MATGVGYAVFEFDAITSWIALFGEPSGPTHNTHTSNLLSGAVGLTAFDFEFDVLSLAPSLPSSSLELSSLELSSNHKFDFGER